MFKDCIEAEDCFKCGRKKDNKSEVMHISGISEDDTTTTTAYCAKCYYKARKYLICNKITKYIYKRWQKINLLAEGLLYGLFHKSPSEQSYSGQLEGGVPHGHGSFWNNGYKYVGEFKKGMFDGYGTLYYPEGDKYVGYWKEGKWHGRGIYYTENGSKVAFEYGKDGKNYYYGTCHISGIHKYLWYLLIVLFVSMSLFLVQSSLSTSEQAAVGLLMGIVSVVMMSLVLYFLLHVVAFLVALISKLL